MYSQALLHKHVPSSISQGSPLIFPSSGSLPAFHARYRHGSLSGALQSLSLPVAHPSPHAYDWEHPCPAVSSPDWLVLSLDLGMRLHCMPSLTQDRTWSPKDIWQQKEANPSLPAPSVMEPTPSYLPPFLSAWVHPPLPPRYTHTAGSPSPPQKPQAINCLQGSHLGQAWPDPTSDDSKPAGNTKGHLWG